MSNKIIQISKIGKLNQKSLSHNEYLNTIQYLDTGNITKNRISELQILQAKKDKIPSRAKRKVKKNTIIYSTVRPNQEHYGFLENPDNNLIVSTGFSTIDVIDENIDPKFIYYLITQKQINAYLHNIGENAVSSYPSIKPEDIGNLKFKIPESLQDQQIIASVLSSLDSKIELNNKINAELQQMAKTLYDYWFVQFDFPDKNGKPYKSSGGKMLWSKELKREIPAGWTVDNILKVADLLGGGTPKTKEPSFWDGDIPFFTPSDTEDSIFVLSTIDNITKDGLDSCSSRLYPKGTIFITARGTVGNINVAAQDMAMNQSCYAIQAKPEINYYYLHQCAINLVHYLKTKSNGSIFDAIVSNDIKLTPIVIPPLPIIQEFGQITKSLYEEILVTKKENKIINELKDWLLPMLMNGQIKVNSIKS